MNPGDGDTCISKEVTPKVSPPVSPIPRLTPLTHKPNYCGYLRVNWNEGTLCFLVSVFCSILMTEV